MTIQYQIFNYEKAGVISSVVKKNITEQGGSIFIPYVPNNTDYDEFKKNINSNSAELYAVDGVLMTPEEAIAYVATLP